MIIEFEYNKEVIKHTLKNKNIKIYSVPVEYSSDGLYIADYASKSPEPLPASDYKKTRLLYHAERYNHMGEEFMNVILNELENVKYA